MPRKLLDNERKPCQAERPGWHRPPCGTGASCAGLKARLQRLVVKRTVE